MASAHPSPPSLFRSFGTVGGFTLFSRMTGFLRDTLQAAFLGAGAAQDAFVFALMFPNLFRRLFAEGAFSAGFVPIFAQLLEKEGQAKAKHFADQAFSLLAIILLIFCGVMMLAMPAVLYLLAPGFREIPGQVERASELARITFPYLFFISLVTLQSGVLNAFHYFAAATFAQALLNITMIAFLLTGVATGGDPAHFLAWGVFAAGIVQFAWVAHACRRAGIGFTLVRPRLSPEIRVLFKRILPVVFGAGIYQINLLIDRIAATLVSVGAVSWLYFADRVNQLPVGVVGVAAGIALVPLLTRQIQSGNESAALANQNRAIEFCLLLTLPAAAGIGLLARPITAVLFERGQFLASDREAVAAALIAFSFGLPAYVLNKALTPGFFGRHDTKTPVMISIAALVTNVVFIAIFLLATALGHVGIALASSISAWLNAALLSVTLYRRGYLQPDARMKRRLPRMAAATMVMMIGLWLGTMGIANVFGPVFGAPGVDAGPEGLRVLMLVALIGGGAVLFAVAAFALGAAERSDLDAFRRKRTIPVDPPVA
jgi:putative peptidoglycan lipid II flippase